LAGYDECLDDRSSLVRQTVMLLYTVCTQSAREDLGFLCPDAEEKELQNISSVLPIYLKIAQQTQECADFIDHYSETKN
jgi:hypothetical protein